MIGAAVDGRFWIGVLIAVLAGAGLVMVARMVELPDLQHPYSIGLAILIASISFAARGALFARRASDKGWWIAVAVLAGEAAIVITALAEPGVLPGWLLALLPAQWANIAVQSAFTGNGARAASSALIALGGTAAATMLVVWLWPRRWTYLVMFAAWLSLSALVYHHSEPHVPRAEKAVAAAEGRADRVSMPSNDAMLENW